MSRKLKPTVSTKRILPSTWLDALKAITINDENWWCMIVMIVETLPEHAMIVNLFDKAADEGHLRKAIYPLTFDTLQTNIKTLCKIPQDKCLPSQTIFHHANDLISHGQNLDAQVIANLIKYQVNHAKTVSMDRRKKESQIDHEVDQEIRAMLTVGKIQSQNSMKSTTAKKSLQSIDTQLPLKVNTRLRKRGEERKDQVYIDDAPLDGPDLFIILTGFRDPHLPLELIKTGVPLSCILKIHRPGESLFTNNNEDCDNQNNSIDHGRTIANKKVIDNFWTTLEKHMNSPENLQDFSTVMVRNFCPPQIPLDNLKDEVKLKKDLYDRISYFVYDLYDLQRLHVDYIRSIKLQNVPEDTGRVTDFNVYKTIMDAVPAECALVPIILQAMLAQVEADFQNTHTFDSSNPARIGRKSEGIIKLNNRRVKIEQLNAQYGIKSNDPVQSVTKIGNSDHILGSDELNARYKIKLDDSPQSRTKVCNPYLILKSGKVNSRCRITLNDSAQSVTKVCNPDLILQNDKIKLKTYHVPVEDFLTKLIKPSPKSLAELALRSFQDTRIINLWNGHPEIPEKLRKKYHYHLQDLTRCFSFPIDSRKLVHYLHLQVFDKMIHDYFNRANSRDKDSRSTITEKGSIPVTTYFHPLRLSSSTIHDYQTFSSGDNPIVNLRSFHSDSIINCHKSIPDTFEFPESFDITDTREIIKPGFLEDSQQKLREGKVLFLEQFANVRLLPSNVFLQEIHESFLTFEDLQPLYIMTTDTILLYFKEKDKGSGYDCSRHQRVWRIVTPVCLRNFCEYVLEEESEWLCELEVTRAGRESTNVRELARKLHHDSEIDITTMFTDDDFILPNSLKGQARRKAENKPAEEIKLGKISEHEKVTVPKSAMPKIHKEDQKITRNVELVEKNSLHMGRVTSLRCARDGEPYKFLGYNLGNLRVQLTSDRKTFTTSDGTVVNVDVDEWLYGKRQIGIGINLPDCFVKLQRIVGDPDSDEIPFHLITGNGIVIALSKSIESQEYSTKLLESNSFGFNFCTSWPSGLKVEVAKGESLENPFYILQTYREASLECGLVSRENYRKFLRNGTVLKFLNDDTIEVMRPNGTIVRCLEFRKYPSGSDEEIRSDGNLTKDDLARNFKKNSFVKEKRRSFSTRNHSRKTINGNLQNQRRSILSSSDQILDEIHSTREEAAGVKITRYTALEHDGRNYEVVNDEVSRVFDRSLVRTSVDFEVGERFIRREDGTTSILNFKGEFIVYFPDGTCITTGFVVEDEPLICDWSDEDFNKFFDNEPTAKSVTRDEVVSLESNNIAGSGSYRSTPCEDRRRIFLAESFVSILITCKMEHKCYTTVAYNQGDKSCQLSMPDEVIIGISQELEFDVKVGSNVEFRIRKDSLMLSSKSGLNFSTSIYEFSQPESRDEATDSERLLFMSTDSGGNVFKVLGDGTVVTEGHGHFSEKPSLNLRPIEPKRGRFFAMNRDLTAYEYVHNSQCDEYQRGMISMMVPKGLPGLEYRLHFNQLKPTNYSQMWLQKITQVKPTNNDRTYYLRSTYSNPYEWIFPYGRNGNGIKINTWKVPITDSIDNHTEVFTLSHLEVIAEDGKNSLIELQKALASYWRKRTTNFRPQTESRDETENSESENEKWYRDLALGIVTSIDLQNITRDLKMKRHELKLNQTLEATIIGKNGQRNSLNSAEIQWYEKCLREGKILPYFKNIRGACFLWVMSCLDSALENLKK